MSCVKAICLRFTGDVAEFNIESNTLKETLSTKLLPKSVKRTQGNGSLSCRCEYPMDDITVSVYCLLYTSPSPRDRTRSRMPSSA